MCSKTRILYLPQSKGNFNKSYESTSDIYMKTSWKTVMSESKRRCLHIYLFFYSSQNVRSVSEQTRVSSWIPRVQWPSLPPRSLDDEMSRDLLPKFQGEWDVISLRRRLIFDNEPMCVKIYQTGFKLTTFDMTLNSSGI